jgi:hypothetical protein
VAQIGNRQAFLPSLAVGHDGSLAVSYYDFRFNGLDTSVAQPLETDHFVVRCATPSVAAPHGCAGPWLETRLTPSSFNLRSEPTGLGLFLGDYMGLAPLQTGFGALFAIANGAADPVSIYFARP